MFFAGTPLLRSTPANEITSSQANFSGLSSSLLS
jgi:hypothetical protein